MNPTGATGSAAAGFGNGTVFVMENYAVLETTDGKLASGSDGKLIKADLLRVFVMGKNAGWGQGAPEPLRNGNWVYASYLANGQKGPEDTATCRGCHLPLASKDFVHRYDEHFAQKKLGPRLRCTAATPRGGRPAAWERPGAGPLIRLSRRVSAARR